MLSGKWGGGNLEIELDGVAYSDTCVMLVERKPIITMEHIEELVKKAQRLR